MNEATYLASLSSDIEKSIGGKVVKISDRSTLGLPDSGHVRDGIVIYIEAKIGDGVLKDSDGVPYVQPWKAIKKDLRQFEVCRSLSQHCCVLYVIYYPEIKRTAVLTIEQCLVFRPKENETTLPYLSNEEVLVHGKGTKRVIKIMNANRREIYGRLSTRVSL